MLGLLHQRNNKVIQTTLKLINAIIRPAKAEFNFHLSAWYSRAAEICNEDLF